MISLMEGMMRYTAMQRYLLARGLRSYVCRGEDSEIHQPLELSKQPEAPVEADPLL